MKRWILPDTDILVDYLRGYPASVAYIADHADRIKLSVMVIAELYAGVRNDEDMRKLDAFVKCFPAVLITAEIARRAGLYRRHYAKSHGVGLSDAVIAATAELEDLDLKTFNMKHYPMINELCAPYAKT